MPRLVGTALMLTQATIPTAARSIHTSICTQSYIHSRSL